MATRRGPQLPILTYDMALVAARVMRTGEAETIEARGVIAPPTGRIDSRTRGRGCHREKPCAGGVHRLSYLKKFVYVTINHQ